MMHSNRPCESKDLELTDEITALHEWIWGSWWTTN